MPSIIPALPGPWPGFAPTSTHTDIGSSYTVASGTTLYFSGMPWIPGTRSAFWTTQDAGTLINNGSVWVREVDDVGFRWGRSGGDVINNGLVVVESTTGRAFGIYDSLDIGTGSGILQNTGQLFVFGHVYAVGLAGRRFGVATYRNDGLIAVRSDAGDAIGFQFGNGNDIAINTATGQILVEGVSAIGVDIEGRNNFTNQGTIVAQTIADPVSGLVENYSIGIAAYIFPAGIGQTGTITNSGTITADIAIRAYSITGYSRLHNYITVNNLTGGTINGAVILEFTNDIMTNSGVINGLVDMREGNDVLDTTSGTINGLVDMGFGDDRFEGSAGADYVLGNKGADILNGAGGADLLLGAAGDDRIVGGAGNDGLYGELGDDLIISQGGDEIFGGDGNDRIELGDLQFYSISGGNGIDTLVLPNGTFSLDWHQLVSSGLVTGIEQLVMRGNQEVAVTAADLAGLAGQTLTVNTAGISDKLDLVGGWTEGAAQTLSGVNYRSFTLNGSTVLVSGGGVVAVVATTPTGLGGLDPYIGKLPPLPGAIPGAELSSNVWIARTYEPGTDFTIDSGETWLSDPDTPFGVLNGLFFIYDNIAFRNDGVISYNMTWGGRVMDIGFVYTVTNNGSLIAHADQGYVEAISIGQHGTVRNTGIIEVVARDFAYGIINPGIDRDYDQQGNPIDLIPCIYNSGSISVTSNESYAVAINAGGETILNYGSIQATGGRDTSGIRASGSLATFENTGTLSATLQSGASGRTLGIWVTNLYYDNNRLISYITNSGTISASVAILVNGQANVLPPPFTYPMANLHLTNTNIINGDITLTDTVDTVINSGTISGTVSLGAGNDSFDGSLGMVVGLVCGEAGNDTLTGGAQADWFDGGAGDDAIQGGSGIDRAVYASAEIGVTVDLRITVTQHTIGAGIDILSSIEELSGSGFADTLIGNGLTNRLDGGADNDLLTGGGGDDRIIGGEGQTDVAVYSGSRVDYLIEEVTIDGLRHFRVTGQGSAAGDGVDLLSGVEVLRFSDQDLRIGNDRPVLGAAVMPDQIASDGFFYSYQIPASAFFDANGDPLNYSVTLANGLELPTWLTFDAATRTLSGAPPLAAVGTQLDIRVTATDNFPGDPGSQMSDSFALTIVQAPGADVNGTVNPDTVNGTFRAERMFGFDSDDTLNGSDGADQIDGGNGNDTVSYAGSGTGVAVVLSSGEGSSGQAAGDTYVSIENVTGSTFGDLLIGNAGANVLTGNGGIDTLDGGAGNDRLVVSAAGNGSSVDGGADSDTLVVSGAVTLGSLAGIEAVQLSGSANLTLSTSQLMSGLAFNTQISGSGTITINLEAGVFTTITGFQNAGSSVNFVYNGSAGGDNVKAGHFLNTISGGIGADFLRGGNLVDTIDGGADRDKITGWGGADVLTGGGGADQFRYLFATDSGVGAAADRITDFTIGSDVIDLRLLDSDLGTPNIQNYALSFIGSAAFGASGASQIRYGTSGADMLVQFDLDGNGSSDMEIVLQGLAGQTLSASDFLLTLAGAERLSAKDAAPEVMDQLNAAAKLPAEDLAGSDPLLTGSFVDPFDFPDHGLIRWPTSNWDWLPVG